MRMLEVTPPRPGHLCPPRHVPVPPTLARDRDSSDRCSPCPVLVPLQGDTGGAQGAAPPLDSTHLFYVFFFYVFPFSSFPPPPFLSRPPPPSSLSLAFLSAFLQGKPALPPPRGPSGWGPPPAHVCVSQDGDPPPGWGHPPPSVSPPPPRHRGGGCCQHPGGGIRVGGREGGVGGHTHTRCPLSPKEESAADALSPPPQQLRAY